MLRGRPTSLYASVIAGYILLVGSGSFVIVLALSRLNGLNHSMLELTLHTERTNVVRQVRQDVNAAMELRVKMDVYKDPEYKTEFGRTLELLVSELTKLKSLSVSPEEKRFAAVIEEAVIKGVLPKIETGKLTDPDDTTLNEFLSLLDAEIANTDAKIYTMVLNSSLKSRRAVRLLFGVFGFSLALSLAVGLWVVMDLKGQIRRIIDATEHVAKGLFTTQIPEEGPQEIRALSQSFNRMVERLGELEKLKESFIANVTHEIKTPLTSVKEATSLLREGVVGPLTKEQEELLEIIEQDGHRLLRLVNDLLDLSKMEAGMTRYQFHEGRIEGVLQGSVRKSRVVAEKNGIRLDFRLDRPSAPFMFDHFRMEQAFDNLLANALKFTPAGGKVEVCLSEDPVGRLAIAFRDTGQGIPPQYHEAVFSKFFQVEEPGTYRGTGLGLSIVKHIVEAHGGRIELSSGAGEGSVFTLLFERGRTPGREVA